jgi:molybdate transport system substrate-binding protein
MTKPLHMISSMATRQVLAELTAHYVAAGGTPVHVESVGGVDAARRVAAGEAFDSVVLAADAIDKLIAAGHVLAGSRVDLVHSPVAVAVRAGASVPALGNEEALRRAVLAAPTIGYSTGPSGTALLALFERWGLMDTLRARLIQAAPGVPVGTMVGDGRVALGFQQLAELMNLPGVTLAGLLPEPVAIVTTFSAGIARTSARVQELRDLHAHLAGAAVAGIKQRCGMQGFP